MIKHVALIHFKEGTGQAAREAVLAAFRKLPAAIPQVRSYTVGLDLGLLEGNAGIAVVGEFATREDFLAYSQHPAHTDIILPVCGPVMSGYSTAQFEI
jgi:hypothetical protein